MEREVILLLGLGPAALLGATRLIRDRRRWVFIPLPVVGSVGAVWWQVDMPLEIAWIVLGLNVILAATLVAMPVPVNPGGPGRAAYLFLVVAATVAVTEYLYFGVPILYGLVPSWGAIYRDVGFYFMHYFAALLWSAPVLLQGSGWPGIGRTVVFILVIASQSVVTILAFGMSWLFVVRKSTLRLVVGAVAVVLIGLGVWWQRSYEEDLIGESIVETVVRVYLVESYRNLALNYEAISGGGVELGDVFPVGRDGRGRLAVELRDNRVNTMSAASVFVEAKPGLERLAVWGFVIGAIAAGCHRLKGRFWVAYRLYVMFCLSLHPFANLIVRREFVVFATLLMVGALFEGLTIARRRQTALA